MNVSVQHYYYLYTTLCSDAERFPGSLISHEVFSSSESSNAHRYRFTPFFLIQFCIVTFRVPPILREKVVVIECIIYSTFNEAYENSLKIGHYPYNAHSLNSRHLLIFLLYLKLIK